ncbi:MAG: beta-ketoacyl synthase N-terminal-like domain-containing protein [Clostridia bacterium]
MHLGGDGDGNRRYSNAGRESAGNFLSSIEEVVKQAAPYEVEVRVIANACCAGAQAIAYATDLLRMNQYDYVIAGGIEIFSYLIYCGFARLFALDKEGCRPFDRNRKGISVGEGAAFLHWKRELHRKIMEAYLDTQRLTMPTT